MLFVKESEVLESSRAGEARRLEAGGRPVTTTGNLQGGCSACASAQLPERCLECRAADREHSAVAQTAAAALKGGFRSGCGRNGAVNWRGRGPEKERVSGPLSVPSTGVAG